MRSRLLVLPALLLGALLVSAPSALAGPPMTTLKVEVKTLSDKPVERASVIVTFVSGRDYVKLGKKIHTTWQTKTNQEGVAKMPPLPQGNIRVQVISKGYMTFGQIFEVTEEERTIEVKLSPPQPQYSAH